MSEISLHSLQPAPGARKQARRIGRGGKRGTTAGRGTKGQRARSGGRNKLGYLGVRHVMLQTPQRRGHSFGAVKQYVTVNISALDSAYVQGDIVTLKNLAAKRILKKTNRKLKVLGDGKLTKPLTVKAHAFSESARVAIEKAGGKIEIIS